MTISESLQQGALTANRIVSLPAPPRQRSQAWSFDLRFALDNYNRHGADCVRLLDIAFANDPMPAMALIAKGLVLSTTGYARYRAEIQRCLSIVAEFASALNARERAYLMALGSLYRGDFLASIRALEHVVEQHPTDLFALRLAQQTLTRCREHNRMYRLLQRTATHWSGDEQDFPGWLALLAFGNAQVGKFDVAENIARQSLGRDPTEIWAAHTLAHVYEFRGQADIGLRELRPLTNNWADVSEVARHVCWHLALFYLQQGRVDETLELLRSRLIVPASSVTAPLLDADIDLANLTSLLLRLRLRNFDVHDLWSLAANTVSERIDDSQTASALSPLASYHCAIVVAATGRVAAYRKLLQTMTDSANTQASEHGRSVWFAATAVARAVFAHFRNEHDDVVLGLMPIRNAIWRIGGAHADHDMLMQLLFYSCVKTNRLTMARTLLNERRQLGYEAIVDTDFWRISAQRPVLSANT